MGLAVVPHTDVWSAGMFRQMLVEDKLESQPFHVFGRPCACGGDSRWIADMGAVWRTMPSSK